MEALSVLPLSTQVVNKIIGALITCMVISVIICAALGFCFLDFWVKAGANDHIKQERGYKAALLTTSVMLAMLSVYQVALWLT